MAEVNSIITGKFRGLLGKELVFRDWAGKTVVAKAPKKRKGLPSVKQAKLQERFLIASRYAKAVISNTDQSMAEAYATALRPRQNVYSRAVEDFMSSPVVSNIDSHNYSGNMGDTITVRAIDDFRVVSVRVEVYAASGLLLEAANAVVDTNGIDWTYTVSEVNNVVAGSKIIAIATDVPGNEGAMEVTL